MRPHFILGVVFGFYAGTKLNLEYDFQLMKITSGSITFLELDKQCNFSQFEYEIPTTLPSW